MEEVGWLEMEVRAAGEGGGGVARDGGGVVGEGGDGVAGDGGGGLEMDWGGGRWRWRRGVAGGRGGWRGWVASRLGQSHNARAQPGTAPTECVLGLSLALPAQSVCWGSA